MEEQIFASKGFFISIQTDFFVSTGSLFDFEILKAPCQLSLVQKLSSEFLAIVFPI